jgi:hypothetical protein
MTPDQRRPSRPAWSSRQILVLVLASFAQLAILLWAAHAAVHQALQCEVCDTSNYYTAAGEIARTGLLFHNPDDGYRSYFVPLFVAAVQRALGWLGFEAGGVLRYTYGVSLLFWLVSAALMTWSSRHTSMRAFVPLALATLVNPFLIVYVPFALQEGVLMAWCLPLLFVWLTATHLNAGTRAALVLLMALVAYIVRAALAWWLLLAAIYAVWVVWPHLRRPMTWLPSLAATVLAACLLIGPQVYISKVKFDSYNPYPVTRVLPMQFALSVSILKYATVEEEGHWRGLVYWSPYFAEPGQAKGLGFYVDYPVRGLFLMLSHAYAGFHYDQILPYWQLVGAWRLAVTWPSIIWLALSSAVAFLGFVRMADLTISGAADADDAFAIATFALCAGALMFVVTESRFGLVGFAMLSIYATDWIANARSRREWSLLIPALLMYIALSFLYNTLLQQSADIRL